MEDQDNFAEPEDQQEVFYPLDEGQIYFMHKCFSENYYEVIKLIDDFGYGKNNAMVNDKGLVPIQKSGYKITWWYLPGSEPETGKKVPLYSNIELDYIDVNELIFDDFVPTEVKITCSDNPYLIEYFTKLAIHLWNNLNHCDERLKLKRPGPDAEPYFKSLIDYVMQHGIEVIEKASDEEKETNTGISKIELSESKTPSQDSEKPWEKIPDHLWDKQALNMWHEGYTNSEIAKKVCVTPERVTNRISELRKEHGSGIVPFDEDRRKKLRGNKYRKE